MSRALSIILVLILTLVPLSASVQAAPGRVLIVLSAARTLPLLAGKSHPTGHFLGELAEPLLALLAAGYEVDYASPDGGAPVIDPDSLRTMYWLGWGRGELRRKCLDLVKSQQGFAQPLNLHSLGEAERSRYVAIFFPGGHAPMVDIAKDPYVAQLLQEFHRDGKPIGLICHGPVALLSLRGLKPWPFEGYRVSVFSNIEERFAEKLFLKGKVEYYPETSLRDLGAKIKNAFIPSTSHVEVDRELVTGQNAFSPFAFGKAFVAAIRRYQASGPLR